MPDQTQDSKPLPPVTDRQSWQARGLLDMTVYGRQETWEDSPEGWPQRWGPKGGQFQLDGRPAAHWVRLEQGRSDDLGT